MTNKKAVFVLNVKCTVISILIDVWLCKCVADSTFFSAQRRVFILSWPLAQETHSVFLSLHQKIAELLCISSLCGGGKSPGVGLLYDMSVPNLIPQLLLCHFLHVHVSVLWDVAPCSPCVQIPYMASISAGCLPLNHNRSPFIVKPLFCYWKLSFEPPSWSMKYKLLYWHWQVFKLLIRSRLCSLNRQNDAMFRCRCRVPACHVFLLRDSNICLCHKHRASGCQWLTQASFSTLTTKCGWEKLLI